MTPNYAVNPPPDLDLRSIRALLPARVIAALRIMRMLSGATLIALLGGCACAVESMYIPTSRAVTTFGEDFLAVSVTPEVDLLLTVHRRNPANPSPDMEEIYVRAALEVGPDSYVQLASDSILVSSRDGAEKLGVQINAIEYSRWCEFDKPTKCSTTEESPVKGERTERPDVYYRFGRFYSFKPTLKFQGAVDTEAQGTLYRLPARDYRRYFLKVDPVFMRDADEIEVQIPTMSIDESSYTVPAIRLRWTRKEFCRSAPLQ